MDLIGRKPKKASNNGSDYMDEPDQLPTSMELEKVAPTDPKDQRIQAFKISEIDIIQVESSAKKMVTKMMYPVIE